MAVSVHALASLLVLCAAPGAGRAPRAPSALERAAESVAEAALAGAPAPARRVAVSLHARQGACFARAAETAVVSALGRRGAAGVVVLSADAPDAAERSARAGGADLLVRLEVALEGGQLVVVGDWVPTWVNFWTGREAIRGRGGAPLSLRLPADEGTLDFARASAAPVFPAAAPRFRLRPLLELEGRVVALAIGDLDRRPGAELAVLTEPLAAAGQPGDGQVQVFGADGARLAQSGLSRLPPAPRGPREPAGTLAILPPSAAGGLPRLAAFAFERAQGALFELDGTGLTDVGSSDYAVLGAGLLGRPLEARNLLAAEVLLPGGAAARLPFPVVALLPNPAVAGAAWLAVGEQGRAALLGQTLEVLEATLPPLGAGSALADFDGDGLPEVAASLPVRTGDRVRVLRLAAGGSEALFQSEPVRGHVAAAAAGDLGGEGRSEAVFACWLPEGRTALVVLEVEP